MNSREDLARVEYEQICINVRTISGQYWIGFSTFFAANALLAASYNSTFSANLVDLNPGWIFSARFLVALLGVFIGVGAIKAARVLDRLMTNFLKRGIEIEEEYDMKMLKGTNDLHQRSIFVELGAVTFVLFWLVASGLAISMW